MPLGRYTMLGDDGAAIGTEEFRCAPGPMGWRYFSEVTTDHREIVDVAVDADWRIARVRIDTGDHDILLEPSGDTLAGYGDRREVEIPYGPRDHLDYCTPATNAITVRRLGATAEIDVVYLEPVTLEPSRVRQRYEALGAETVRTPVGRFEADRWRFTDVASGWTADLWVAGDVVVAYERLFVLAWYEPGANGARPVP
jgi:Putative glycolipid-binding